MSNFRQSCIFYSTIKSIIFFIIFIITFKQALAFDQEVVEEAKSLLQQIHKDLDKISEEGRKKAVQEELRDLAENCIHAYASTLGRERHTLSSLKEDTDPKASFHHKDFHIVFDLDGTLVSEAKGDKIFGNTLLIKPQGRSESYHVFEHVPQVLNHLSQQPGVKVSFFSGGEHKRNQEILKSLYLTQDDKTTAFDIAYKILSKEDLSSTDVCRGRFCDRFKKDLTKVHEDLGFTLLIDDIPFFLSEGQKRSLITFNIEPRVLTTFEDYSQTDSDRERAPSTLFNYALSESRVAGVYGLLDVAIRHLKGSVNSTLVDVVERLAPLHRVIFIEHAFRRLYQNTDERRCSLFLKDYLQRKIRYLAREEGK